MKRLKKIFFCLVCLLFFTNTAGLKTFGQTASSVSVTGHVFAEVIEVFSATETAQMNFGRFSPGPQGGEIILTPQSSISVLGSVFKSIGTHNAASFHISGDSNSSFTITLPDDPVILKQVSGSKTMIIKDWISSIGSSTGAGILQDGSQTIYVGATLKVGALSDNPAGVYAGTYNITFDFN